MVLSVRDKTKNEARRRSRRDFSATTPIIKIVVITASHCRRAFTSALLCPPKLGVTGASTLPDNYPFEKFGGVIHGVQGILRGGI